MQEEVKLVDTVEMARRLLAGELKDVDFQVDISEDAIVAGNSNQLCQVFVNIMQNSVQALEGSRERGVEPKLEVRSEPTPSGRIKLTIRDNGPGIEAEDLDHVFDPFFTKREVGEGMGLGLSICHRILQSHQGRIDVDSVPGEYTEFQITLPRPWDEGTDEEEEEDPDPNAVQLEEAHTK